jgi:hypothetical protein
MFHELNIRASNEPYCLEKYAEESTISQTPPPSRKDTSPVYHEYVRCQKIISDINAIKKVSKNAIQIELPEVCKKYMRERPQAKSCYSDIILVL